MFVYHVFCATCNDRLFTLEEGQMIFDDPELAKAELIAHSKAEHGSLRLVQGTIEGYNEIAEEY